MVDKIITERGSNYGPAKGHFSTTQKMFNAFDWRYLWSPNKPEDKSRNAMILHAVYMILDKLARAAWNPWHIDNWKDIQGYAQLVIDELLEGVEHED